MSITNDPNLGVPVEGRTGVMSNEQKPVDLEALEGQYEDLQTWTHLGKLVRFAKQMPAIIRELRAAREQIFNLNLGMANMAAERNTLLARIAALEAENNTLKARAIHLETDLSDWKNAYKDQGRVSLLRLQASNRYLEEKRALEAETARLREALKEEAELFCTCSTKQNGRHVSMCPVGIALAALTQPAPEATCSNCGHAVQDGWTFCPHCAEVLDREVADALNGHGQDATADPVREAVRECYRIARGDETNLQRLSGTGIASKIRQRYPQYFEEER